MILNNKQIDEAHRMADILTNPYLRSLSGNISAPLEKSRQLRWIIPLVIIFVIAVINIMVKI